MMAGEMATALRLKIPVVFVLFTDRSLSLIRVKQEHSGAEPGYGTVVGGEGCGRTESFFGVPVLPARDREEFKASLEGAFSMGGPVIVEAFIDGSEYGGLITEKYR